MTIEKIYDGLYVHKGARLFSNDNLYIFDVDWTIIRPIKNRFFKDSNDYAFLPNRIKYLKYIHTLGYKIIFITNQGYTGKKLNTAIDRLNNMLYDIFNQIPGIDLWCLVGTKDNFKKPSPNIWNYLLDVSNLSLNDFFGKNNAIFIGDAGGEIGDYSDNDIIFAKNIGVSYNRPENIFPQNQVSIPENQQCMLIFVGMQGSGKSTFYHKNLEHKGWVHANQDILKTEKKVLKTIETALSGGQSVAVDATNPTVAKRKLYINLAIKYQIPTLIVYFVRNGYEYNKLREKPVPTIAYSMYFKNLEEPTSETDCVPVIQIEKI